MGIQGVDKFMVPVAWVGPPQRLNRTLRLRMLTFATIACQRHRFRFEVGFLIASARDIFGAAYATPISKDWYG